MAIYSIVERIWFVATTVWQGVTWIKRCTVLQPGNRDHELGFSGRQNYPKSHTLPYSYQGAEVVALLRDVSRVLPGRTQGQFYENLGFSPNWSWQDRDFRIPSGTATSAAWRPRGNSPSGRLSEEHGAPRLSSLKCA